MFKRYISAASSGVLVTLGLLFIMQALINITQTAQAEPRIRAEIDWIGKIEETEVRKIEETFQKEDLIDHQPQPPRHQQPAELEAVSVPHATPLAPVTELPPSFGSMGDGPLVNLVRVSPVYPAAALTRELEGWVVVQFDVDTNGRTSNITVVQSSNRIFDKAAMKAAARFKFKPRVINGIAQPVAGIQNLFRFEIEK